MASERKSGNTAKEKEKEQKEKKRTSGEDLEREKCCKYFPVLFIATNKLFFHSVDSFCFSSSKPTCSCDLSVNLRKEAREQEQEKQQRRQSRQQQQQTNTRTK